MALKHKKLHTVSIFIVNLSQFQVHQTTIKRIHANTAGCGFILEILHILRSIKQQRYEMGEKVLNKPQPCSFFSWENKASNFQK